MASGKHSKSAHVFHSKEYYPSRARISRAAFCHNLARAREYAGGAEVMAIVKADAYGHGVEEITRWAQAEGVRWFGIAQLGEAMALRRKIGEGAHILSLMAEPDAPLADALELGIDLTVGSEDLLDRISHASAECGMAARVHIEVDTGMARGGVSIADFPEFAETLADYEESGLIEVIGLWSHLACADEPDSPVTAEQVKLFEQAQEILSSFGVQPECVHLAASAGIIWHPRTHYTMVRPGIMLYGLSPNPEVATAQELDLEPVMRLEASVVSVRDVPQNTGVSYGHTAHTQAPAHLATVPLGYADGIARSASNSACVHVHGQLRPIVGRVCMDQFVIDAPGVHVGDTVTLFGGECGSPSADDWGRYTGTIGYEIVTRIGVRVPREYCDDEE